MTNALRLLGLGLSRSAAAALLTAPGVLLMALYASRLQAFRADPALAPGTPAETVIALIVVIVAAASIALGLAAGRGRVAKPAGAAGFMSLACVVLVVAAGFVRVY